MPWNLNKNKFFLCKDIAQIFSIICGTSRRQINLSPALNWVEKAIYLDNFEQRFLSRLILSFFHRPPPQLLTLQGRGHREGGGRVPRPPTFLSSKNKWETKKNERVSKQILFKGCYQGQNIIVLVVLERLSFKNFSYWSSMVADNTFQCPIAPQPWNLFRRPCIRYDTGRMQTIIELSNYE